MDKFRGQICLYLYYMCEISYKIRMHGFCIELLQNADVNNSKFIEGVVEELIETRRELRRAVRNMCENDERVKDIEHCLATFTFRFVP